MKRVLIFLSLMAALVVALIVVNTPQLLLYAAVLGAFVIVVRLVWHYAGFLAQGRPRPDGEDGL